ncbi:hypothetical protein JYU34_001501 [Plutella xylostella]|uniref:Uncharacterized protein n=1 Tax=Plutella xylostella TaxID=51655 RepID=A0ABQ7R430_PLUXY|nr:hypothetical protein JYU34_001501 [Plutella xylostella]
MRWPFRELGWILRILRRDVIEVEAGLVQRPQHSVDKDTSLYVDLGQQVAKPESSQSYFWRTIKPVTESQIKALTNNLRVKVATLS